MHSWSEYWTGTDTNNGLPFPSNSTQTEHFYIGRLGGELRADTMGFDVAAAKKATMTFGYWDLAGAQSIPSGMTPTNWGQAQGRSAVTAAKAHQYVHGTTLFLDVEPGNGGWGPVYDLAANRQVLSAALAAIQQLGYTPGVYVSPSLWLAFFGVGYVPKTPFVLWLAGTDCPSTAESAMTIWDQQPSVGGQRPGLWQYSVSGGGCPDSPNQDWNVTPYSGWLHGTWEPTPVSPSSAPGSASPAASGTLRTELIRRLNTVSTDLQVIITALDDGQL